MSSFLECKIRIKEWEREFSANHGRAPSKADVKAEKQMWKAYKAYNEMKRSNSLDESSGLKSKTSSASEQTSKSKSPKGLSRAIRNNSLPENKSQKLEVPSSVNVWVDDDDEYEPLVPVQNAELGPTPQANGKVLSLFDLILSPPESSPIKKDMQGHKLRENGKLAHPISPFKTPTKSIKHIDLESTTPSRGLSVAEKLKLASSPMRNTNLSRHEEAIETPRYLGKVNSKFAFNEQEIQPQGSPTKRSIFQTPTKAPSTELFGASPSPLKSQRLISSRLLDIFNAHQNMIADADFEAQKKEFEVVSEENENTPEEQAPSSENVKDLRKRKKATTQKRTTRRWKIKPRYDGDNGDSFEGKDVHEEIQKLETQDRSHLAHYIEGEATSEESHDDEDEDDQAEHLKRKKPASTKINPVSNNFQRLKINDPRAKKFKQRMRRR